MDLSEYIPLIQSYIAGQIPASEFESRYLKLFKEEKRIPPPRIYEILNGLFTDVDAFSADAKLRSQSSLNEEQLLERAKWACQELKIIASEHL